MTPQELKSSILQLAIQGKLVEQRPEEGTGEELYQQIQAEKQRLIQAGKIKKEKPLPEIAEDEVPFEIPEGWKWVRLQNMSEQIVDCPHSTPRYYDTDTGYYVIGTKCYKRKYQFNDYDIFIRDIFNQEKIKKEQEYAILLKEKNEIIHTFDTFTIILIVKE